MSVPAVEIQRQEEASAVASILVETPFKNDTESIVNESQRGQSHNIVETEKNDDIKLNLPNNASYLIFKDCGQNLGEIISLLLKRRSQKLSSFEAFASDAEPLDLSKDCSALNCREVWVQPRVLFKLELLDKGTIDVKALETEVIEEVLSNIVGKQGLALADLEVSVSRYDGHLESVDLRKRVTSIDNTLVVIKSMTGTADETQELVHEDDCPEPPPRTSTPVPGHHEDISGPFNTTDILLREHSYSRVGSVSFSEHQNLRSVSSYPSLSVSAMEGAEADMRQTTTTSPELSGYTASVSASLTNQMPGYFGGGDSGISSRASSVTGAASPQVSTNLASTEKMYLGGGELEEVGPRVFTSSRHSSTQQSEVIPVPSVHEVVVPGSVTAAMASFVFTSSILTPDGGLNIEIVRYFNC